MSNILLVDDDPHIRPLVRVLLEHEGFTVTEAEDGVAALAQLAAVSVDLVVLDLVLSTCLISAAMSGCSRPRSQYLLRSTR